MATIIRVLVALLLPKSVPALIKRAQGVVAALTNNAAFPSPTPPLATVTAHINTLATMEVAAGTRASGTAAARDDQLRIVVADLHQLKGYVQAVADQNPESAAALITSAGMSTRKAPVRSKAPLAIKQGPVSGSIALVAKAAAKRAAYAWQWSLDQKTWTTLPDTLQAKTTASGFTPGVMVYARSRAVLATGEGDWSQVVCLIVR
jgi:hypothetical protein